MRQRRRRRHPIDGAYAPMTSAASEPAAADAAATKADCFDVSFPRGTT